MPPDPSFDALITRLRTGDQDAAVELFDRFKTVVGQRLNLAGIRWGADGTDEVCHLRALFESEPSQWAAFWNRSLNGLMDDCSTN